MKRAFYLGESKFDKLRRISLIKTISDEMGMQEGDYVQFFRDEDGYIIIQKKPTEKEKVDIFDDSLSPEHQMILGEAVMKLMDVFIKDPTHAREKGEEIMASIIAGFPEENREYLRDRLSEALKTVGKTFIKKTSEQKPGDADK